MEGRKAGISQSYCLAKATNVEIEIADLYLHCLNYRSKVSRFVNSVA